MVVYSSVHSVSATFESGLCLLTVGLCDRSLDNIPSALDVVLLVVASVFPNSEVVNVVNYPSEGDMTVVFRSALPFVIGLPYDASRRSDDFRSLSSSIVDVVIFPSVFRVFSIPEVQWTSRRSVRGVLSAGLDVCEDLFVIFRLGGGTGVGNVLRSEEPFGCVWMLFVVLVKKGEL